MTQSGVLCPEPGESDSGSLSGATVLQAFVDNGTTLFQQHGHQFSLNKDGAMVELITT